MSNEWTEIAWEPAVDCEFRLSRRGDRWQCCAALRPHDDTDYCEKDTEGRGDSPEEACEAIRRDVFAWCRDEERRADYATALRSLVYAAEDCELENE